LFQHPASTLTACLQLVGLIKTMPMTYELIVIKRQTRRWLPSARQDPSYGQLKGNKNSLILVNMKRT